jgi:hypothetical protein
MVSELLDVASYARLAHVLLFALLFGTAIWRVTESIILLKALRNQKEQFGTLQSVLFSAYFKLNAGALALLLLCTWPALISRQQRTVLLVAGALSLINSAVLGPLCNTRLLAWHRVFKDNGLVVGDKAPECSDAVKAELATAKKRFHMLHGISNLVNLAYVATLVLHGISISNKL